MGSKSSKSKSYSKDNTTTTIEGKEESKTIVDHFEKAISDNKMKAAYFIYSNSNDSDKMKLKISLATSVSDDNFKKFFSHTVGYPLYLSPEREAIMIALAKYGAINKLEYAKENERK